MIDKAYLEITNICNLRCSFCHGTKRAPRMLTDAEFELITDRLAGEVKFLYFHLMGEPLLHPSFPHFVKRAWEKGFYPILTTNGSLLAKCGQAVLENLPYKISISLHAPQGEPTRPSPITHTSLTMRLSPHVIILAIALRSAHIPRPEQVSMHTPV